MENPLEIVEPSLHEKFLQLIAAITGSPVTEESTREELREKIAIVEAKMRIDAERQRFEPSEYELKHNFTDDSYVRSIYIPAGDFLVGKLHKHKHVNFVEHGKVSVLTEFGHALIEAPDVIISEAGTKRVLLVHEDLIWTGIHVTDSKDLDEIEDQVIAKNYAQIGWVDPVIDIKKLQGE